ncbi:uncharacterized protein MYCGRDRAFT_110759 [Zymoseptoria tritici IPO323]|uniref:DUF7580 domain-containing protein n=1 Tax=Zymoseptoria tritici (strain CBS 115943 / IPO323) TaxID=336722 RepID=F9XK99_ZYMTI|nr:uncharacterized protein MYCGRDRAFT_110759 [Zymoseptoria tritici IPO323]EGP84679.1 hypothetical protein MYCGRDRAFT_110759 [Zymoseptoria tritici IPO323]
MSGFEIAGLVLGGLPLIIAAMEFFEDTHKAPKIWWKIRRAHRRDLGRLRDCELSFQQNMKELLLPLQMDGTISKEEYATLLAHPDCPGWDRIDLQEALADRLSDCCPRYLEILRGINGLLRKLAAATMVDDELFQRQLEKKEVQLMFQLRRLQYSATTFRRDALIDEMEQLNSTLLRFLRSNDRIVDRNGPAHSGITRGVTRKFRTLLALAYHAERMYRALRNAWQCNCVALHCARVWLKHRSASEAVQLEMLIEFASAREMIPAGVWTRRQLAIKLMTEEQAKERTVWSQGLSEIQGSSSGREASASVQGPPAKRIRLDTDSTLCHFKATTLLAGAQVLAQSGGSKPKQIQETGLCAVAMSCSANVSGSLGLLNSEFDGHQTQDIVPGHQYEVVYLASETQAKALDQDSESLGDLLEKTKSDSLFRVERLTVAFMVTSSFLQLFSTPWFQGNSTADDIFLSAESTSSVLGPQRRQPFVLARFGDQPSEQAVPNDVAFMELGIVLLELCFHRRLHDHPRFKEHMANAAISVQGLIRSAVASEWAKDVQYEAGIDYAMAVDWCLHKASLRNPDWRIDFARHVVQPLERCHVAGLRATQIAL